MAANGIRGLRESSESGRLGSRHDEEAFEEEEILEEEAAALGEVAGLTDRCEGLSLVGGVESGGFKLSGSGPEGGGGGKRTAAGGSGGSAGANGATQGGSGGSIVFQGYGLYVTVRMWREFSPRTLEKAMKGAWAPLGSMKMTIVEDNLFLFCFDHRPDVNKVLREGPWRLHDHPLAIAEAKPGLRIRREQLVEIPYWIQIFNVPPFYQSEATARGVGLLISKQVLAVDATVRRQPGVSTPFIRTRVVINTAERLPRGTSVWFGDEEVPLAFKYERLLKFCYVCGLVDHEMDDCEGPFPVDFNPAKPPYGDWIRGIPPRVPTWQQYGSGRGDGGSSSNLFMVQQSAPRRPGISLSQPVPRIAWADRETTPKYPPGFEPAAFNAGLSDRLPPKRNIRPVRQKTLEDKDGNTGGKKRVADLMDTSSSGENKGANPFLPAED